jgi:hypothetical protein
MDSKLILADKLLALFLHLVSELSPFLGVFKLLPELLVTVGTKGRLTICVLILLSQCKGVLLLMFFQFFLLLLLFQNLVFYIRNITKHNVFQSILLLSF